MCRSIKKLRWPAYPATDVEINAAATQYVRKISGYRSPSKDNRAAFDAAVAEIAAASEKLLAALQTTPA
jgi:hypothetical protein